MKKEFEKSDAQASSAPVWRAVEKPRKAFLQGLEESM